MLWRPQARSAELISPEHSGRCQGKLLLLGCLPQLPLRHVLMLLGSILVLANALEPAADQGNLALEFHEVGRYVVQLTILVVPTHPARHA